jgi:hypothetical protein
LINGPRYRFEVLNPETHHRERFSCESPDLAEFLKTRARKEAKAKASVCFVAVPVEDPNCIAGYYTLSAASIRLEKLPEEFTRKLPRYPHLPATLLGRLARDLRFKGQGIGNLLMADALHRSYQNSSVIGSVAIITDPKDDNAADFYSEFGFKPLDGQRLFLPMKTVADWLASSGA